MRWIYRFHILIPVIFLAGVSQYAALALDGLVTGEVALWEMEYEVLASAGVSRYFKDTLIIYLSVAWLLMLPTVSLTSEVCGLLKKYLIWVSLVALLGVVGFLFDYSPLSFFPAGIRWLLLLHTSFGLFVLSSSLVRDESHHGKIFYFLILITLVDTWAVLLQFVATENLYNLAFGASRLTGLFGNAGVAAFFSVAICLVSYQLSGVSATKRIVLSLLCMFLALSSGTRFITIAIFIIVSMQIYSVAESAGGKNLGVVKVVFVPIFVALLLMGYESLNNQVDRGDAISQQFDKDGRIGNLISTVDMLLDADAGEVIFGRGLGVGTNTAITDNIANGIDPGIYRFNILVDNVFLTCIFQFGLIGSLVFWYGIYKFICFSKPKSSESAKKKYNCILIVILLTLIVGSPLEQYFLMISFAISLGSAYWTEHFDQLKMQSEYS